MLQVIQDPGKVFRGYSKCEKLKPLVNGHLAAIKSYMLQKRSNNSLNCFRGQILSETKTREINAGIDRKHAHRSHDHSIGKDNLLRENEESSTAYSTSFSKVPSFK